jgi:hypothetical protein
MAPDGQSPGFIAQHRFALVFLTLILFLVLVPVAQLMRGALDPHALPLLEDLLFILLLAGTAVSVSSSRAGKLAALGIALPTAVLSVLHGVSGSSPIGVARHLLGMVFLCYAIVLMLRFIFTRQKVTSNTICASLCIYLLIGIIWALAYSSMGVFDRDAFRSTAVGAQGSSDLGIGSGQEVTVLYFSFCTLTTLGYGDIVPVSPMARALATLEAITGQLFLAVLVARLVGLHIAESMAADEKGA